jgi:Na+-transporting methylmalonyl-CoA/oxaloacetate decarboxylase gamma subunit
MDGLIFILIIILIFLVKSFKYFSKRVSPSEKKGEKEES